MPQRMQNELLYPVDTFCPMGELKFYFLGNFDLIFYVLFGIWLPLLFGFFFFFLINIGEKDLNQIGEL